MEAEAITDLSGQTIKGYELQEKIGAGGFGIVYRAYQPLIKREVALKAVMPEFVNHPNFVRRFEAEAQLVAHVEHIHIVPLYDYWRDQTGAYLVMRWLRGGSLQAELEKGPWPLEDVARLLDQIAAGLTTAHRAGVIHRDLKPANILLDEDHNAYIADFGIAKDLEHFSDWATVMEEEESGAFMGSPAYQSPEQIRSETIGPQSDIYSLGVMLYEILTGRQPFHGEPISTLIFKHLEEDLPHLHEVRPELPVALNRVISRATAKAPAKRYESTLELAADFRRALAEAGYVESPAHEDFSVADLDLEPLNPYKGLRAFREADADVFYGREGLVQQLVERMTAGGRSARFLTVVGPSGSGKSSVVRAGLIPQLRRGAVPGSASWYFVEMTPGTQPLEELEAALLRIAINPPSSLLEQLQQDRRGLIRAVKRVLPDDSSVGSELVLVIDQFEETFTRVEDESLREQFLGSLLEAAQDPESRLRIIITLRADFYDRPLLYPEFGQLVRECTEVVLPLTSQELERAISEPARKGGLMLESGLVERIVGDVGEQPGTLPLMQYALTELFERREVRRLTVDAYQEIGGISGALAGRATELYEGLDDAGQHAARQVFLRLVTLGEGAEDTRRRVLLSELLSLQGEDGVVQDVIDLFGKYRLLTFDHDPSTRSPTVEVAHEALIRQWSPLRQWLEQSREDLRLQRRLAASTEEWANANREPSFLATGTRLEQFETWMAETELALTQQERAYLEASLAQREKARAEEAARQEKEAALERRSRNFLRALAAVLALATIGALALTAFALDQRETAEQNASIAESNAEEARGLAFISSAQLALSNGNTDLAIRLALEANRLAESTIQTRRVLAEAAYAPGTRLILDGHGGRVESVAFSPDGRTAASGGRDNSVILWNLETGEAIHRLEGHDDWVLDVTFSPDGARVMSASSDGTLILWDAERGKQIRRFEGHEAAVTSVDFNGDGSRAVSGSHDASVMLWDVETGELARRFEGSVSQILDVAFSESGFTAVSGGKDGTVILWNVDAGTPLRTFGPDEGGHTDEVWAVEYTADELGILSGSEDSTMLLWSFETGSPIMRFEGHTSRVTSVAFSPDGRTAVSGSEDNSVILWDVETGAVIHRFTGHTFLVYGVDFGPDGSRVLSASWDGTVRLWDIDSGAQLRRFDGHSDEVYDVAFSPDGQQAASASLDGSVIVWDAETGETIRRLEGHEAPVNGVAFGPDGERILSGADDQQVILWDAQTGEIIHRMEGHSDGIWSVAFSPDGAMAASGAKDNTVILWDLESGEQIARLFGHTFRVTDVAFSPDGETLLSGGLDNILILWDVETGQQIRQLEGHGDWVYSVAFSPDGQTAVSGSADNSLILWDVATGERLRRFEGHSALIYSVAFSPDGAYVLSGSDDRSIILWDVESGEEVQRFTGHTDDVRGVAFSPDGSKVLSGSGDQSARLWQIRLTLDELTGWIEENRQLRELTCAERERYDVPPLCPRPTPVPLPGSQNV